ncbi:enoyl-CoA hydratase/isomerase family protein [Mycolicibacter hiberniae]|uniref:3-hydroxyisobutyryl-CoA hydrolase n=1 Tax=Mycolicibacter hiberniae TaxID=29314 RepID=A0A7I7WYC8_9MYCO|nr:enoyl-CoA hydratase/isomerase family protein [Mycolicibacter hiberniae]MCV7086579.1 enoyl-CoA hydratase/isomerase family protein [Mycolicibacter hiberniae]ORV69926.1 3-hydroxyisobutyryl-CoA hydrolase [Mycolicibacter hiberniae]BBZ22160.1 3-hydroxyisobutyryl-CoA hydrolase [Mycolicibacter hiberniae]
MTGESDEVLARVDNGVGLLTLNRPKAINSLTLPMVTAMTTALTAWADDPEVTAVVLSGAGERGLCAGGDVVAIYHSAKADGAQARKFWYDEYLLNAQIGSFPKPYVSIMDGIVMGGGVGVGAHANTRVVTDTTKMAMPEVGIGFIPDVGGTYLLSRAPGRLGLHAALTGAPFSGPDAIALGFADHYVPHAQLESFTAAIVADGVDSALAAYAAEPPASQLAAQRDWIDECYAHDTVAEIVEALAGHAGPDANAAAELIGTRSPVACAVTLEAVRRAGRLAGLEEVLIQEFRVSCASLRTHDLVEGIRAQLVDKDRNPQWAPATLAEVTAADIDAYFVSADPDLTF